MTEHTIRRVKWGLLLGLILFACYSCHYYMRAHRRASRAILAGTSFKRIGPPVRVRLSVASGFTLQAPGRVRVTDVKTGRATVEPAPQGSTVQFDPETITWGDRSFAGHVRIAAEGSRLQLNGIPYGGVIELIPAQQAVINEVPCEEYVVGVVGNEMYASAGVDALRAQAIACRTYAIYHRIFRSTGSWHINDEAQIYRGYANVADRVSKAVAETCGLVLTYQGKIFQSYFHSTCGGNTTRASKYFREPDLPPLSGTRCEYCTGSDHFRWKVEYREENVRRILGAHGAVKEELAQAGLQLGRITEIEPLLEPHDAYPEYFRVTFDTHSQSGSFEIHAPLLRALLNELEPKNRFRSVAVAPCRLSGAMLRFVGRGWGHGVGMCTFGAQGQAAAGRDFVTILKHYYPGSTILRAWSKARDIAGRIGESAGPGV